MEERVRMFYDLHNNKWFHILNHTLEVIKADTTQRAMLIAYGGCFFGVNDCIRAAPGSAQARQVALAGVQEPSPEPKRDPQEERSG